jgi:hypothetical protein
MVVIQVKNPILNKNLINVKKMYNFQHLTKQTQSQSFAFLFVFEASRTPEMTGRCGIM